MLQTTARLFIFLCILSLACNEKKISLNSTVPGFSWKDFADSALVRTSTQELTQAGLPCRLTIVPESNLLLVLDIKDTSGFWGKMYSLDSMRFLGNFLKKGEGDGEALNISQMQYSNRHKELYVTDPVTKRIVVFAVPPSGKLPLVYKKNIQPLQSGTGHVSLSRPVILGARKTIVDLYPNNGRKSPAVLLFSDSGLLVQKAAGTLPVADTSLPFYVLNFGLDAALSVSQDEKYLVSTGYNMDLVMLFDTTGQLVRSAHVPAGDDPSYQIQKVSSKSLRVLPGDKNHFAYTGCSRMNGDRLFVLYNGRSIQTSGSHTQTLLLFNSSLQPQQKIHLDTSIYEIDVDWQRRIIYGIGKQASPYLVTYKF